MPQRAIRFPQDVHDAIAAEVQRMGHPHTFSSIVVNTMRAALSSSETPEPGEMTEREALRIAASGNANHMMDRNLTRLGHAGMWKLRQVGEKPITPYVAHGGAVVDRWGVFESYLTPEGEARLAELERFSKAQRKGKR